MNVFLEILNMILFGILGIMVGLIIFVALVMKICEAIDQRKKAKIELRRTLKKLDQFVDMDLQSVRRKVNDLMMRMAALEASVSVDAATINQHLRRIDRQVKNYVTHVDPLLHYNGKRLEAASKRRNQKRYM